MRRALPWVVALSLACGVGMSALSQTPKKPSGGKKTSPTYRTLTGKVEDLKAGERMLTIGVEASRSGPGVARAQSWILAVGNQTLLLRAGKNGQYSTIEFADLKNGEMVQAVAALEADPTDKSHNAWWLVHYPTGTKPPAR